MANCKAKAKSGTQCKNTPVEGSEYCYIKPHQEQCPESGLTDKQRRFIEEYCVDYNATRSAKAAGYSENTASETGYENLRKPQIAEAIKKRMAELSMSAEEATKRMTDWARGDVSPFHRYDEQRGRYVLDLSTEQARQNIHLIREIKEVPIMQKKRQRKELPDGSHATIEKEEVIGMTYEIKLHDAKDAADKILKIWGKYAPEKVDVNLHTPEWNPDNGDPREYVTKLISGK